jgi:hypothetical protein
VHDLNDLVFRWVILELIMISGDNGGVGVIILVVVIWLAVKVWPRANPGARLAAIGGGTLALWLLISVTSPHAGEVMAVGFLTGVRQIASGFADFFNMF